MDPEPHAHRRITRRDGRMEGEPDVEPGADAPRDMSVMKDTQRDLTSLSGPLLEGDGERPRKPQPERVDG